MSHLTNVTYEQYRDIAQDGDIIFIRGVKNSFVQSVIMFFTDSPYSHVGIAFWAIINDSPRLMIVEAQGGSNRRIINLSFYNDGTLIDVIKAPMSWLKVNSKPQKK